MRRIACQILATLLAAPAVAQDQSLTLDMTEVYRVGGVDAREEWAFFGPVLWMNFDGAGNLVVLDVLDNRVVVIGPDGGLVRAVGRKGEGPGEFRHIRALAVWRDGRIAVPDVRHAAIQVFGPGGELERFVRMDDEDKPLSSEPRSRRDSGRSVRREAHRPRRRGRVGRNDEPHEPACGAPGRRDFAGGGRPRARDTGLLRRCGRIKADPPGMEGPSRGTKAVRPTKRIGGRWSLRWKTGTSSQDSIGMCCPTAPSPTPTPRPTPSSSPLPMDPAPRSESMGRRGGRSMSSTRIARTWARCRPVPGDARRVRTRWSRGPSGTR